MGEDEIRSSDIFYGQSIMQSEELVTDSHLCSSRNGSPNAVLQVGDLGTDFIRDRSHVAFADGTNRHLDSYKSFRTVDGTNGGRAHSVSADIIEGLLGFSFSIIIQFVRVFTQDFLLE